MTTDKFKIKWDIDCAMPQEIEVEDSDLLSISDEGMYEELLDLYQDIVQADFKNCVNAMGTNFKQFEEWARTRLAVRKEEEEAV